MGRRQWTEVDVRTAVIEALRTALGDEGRVSSTPPPPSPFEAASGRVGGLSGTCYVEVPSSRMTVYDGRSAATVAASMPDQMVIRVTYHTSMAAMGTGEAYDRHLTTRRTIIAALAQVDADTDRLPVQEVRASDSIAGGWISSTIEATALLRASMP